MIKRLIREGVVIELPFAVWIDKEGIDRIPPGEMRNWEWLRRIMGAITEKIEKAPKWVPVTERLPNTSVETIVSLKSGWVTSDLYEADEQNWFWSDMTPGIHEVTAWMPMPEPYKEGAEG